MNVIFPVKKQVRLIFVIGGYDGQERLATVEYFDPNRPALGWKTVASLQYPRSNFGVTILDNHIVVCGGYNDELGGMNDTEIYLSESNEWKKYGGLNFNKSAHCIECIDNQIEMQTCKCMYKVYCYPTNVSRIM